MKKFLCIVLPLCVIMCAACGTFTNQANNVNPSITKQTNDTSTSTPTEIDGDIATETEKRTLNIPQGQITSIEISNASQEHLEDMMTMQVLIIPEEDKQCMAEEFQNVAARVWTEKYNGEAISQDTLDEIIEQINNYLPVLEDYVANLPPEPDEYPPMLRMFEFMLTYDNGETLYVGTNYTKTKPKNYDLLWQKLNEAIDMGLNEDVDTLSNAIVSETGESTDKLGDFYFNGIEKIEENHDSRKGEYTFTEEEMGNDRNKIAAELKLEMTDLLTDSMEKLYKAGCAEVVSVQFLKEEKGLLYFIVEDKNGCRFYVDTNKRGCFGTVLNEEAYYNAKFLSDALSLELSRELLYSAENLENSGCGKIKAVSDIDYKKAYLFTIQNERNEKYFIRMSAEGAIDEIEDSDGNLVYGLYE